MTGIGVIIMLIQTLAFFGLPTAGGPVASIEGWSRIPGELNWSAVALASLSLAIMIFWPRRFRAALPPALATLVDRNAMPAYSCCRTRLSSEACRPVCREFVIALHRSLGACLRSCRRHLYSASWVAIDSLLTSLIADTFTRTRHNSDKELIGQGIGNMAAGLIGGLPGAGATMRTVVNIRAGGTTGVSGALHALILLALVLGLAPLAEIVPHAVLAGILMKVGWDIIDWAYLKRAQTSTARQALW